MDPFGRIILDCGNKEDIFTTEIDLAIQENIRSSYPFLADRKGA